MTAVVAVMIIAVSQVFPLDRSPRPSAYLRRRRPLTPPRATTTDAFTSEGRFIDDQKPRRVRRGGGLTGRGVRRATSHRGCGDNRCARKIRQRYGRRPNSIPSPIFSLGFGVDGSRSVVTAGGIRRNSTIAVSIRWNNRNTAAVTATSVTAISVTVISVTDNIAATAAVIAAVSVAVSGGLADDGSGVDVLG